ncbi:bifunctional 2-polyprenyl-6-hydroxyphenol methylase/3-demethylubiquinol 3-O-methyltransferase UbiG [Arenibacter sp. ARW7G5Y1]|uniref:class I SAM-dependent methyltransferase n=1 Tax=Arenibacter sp. ARW7G5Y1 TaxID=2135619 RepID=UPI000D757D75|nr:class I SAM-dependent methyltransferase [Arenibacter sp. ARW7G5Y1]PXX27843.1 methyltransferase family protein [Arenibacter sp. ARW7G5Y1]
MKLYLETKDYTVSGESFKLLHDPVLDMLVTEPQPENLGKYYESADYISHTDAKKSVVDKMYHTVKSFNLRSKLSLISSYADKDKTLLDVGAGTGDFLVAAKQEGWRITGIEPNEMARLKAEEKGVLLLDDLCAIPIDQKFGVITLWHVLEHLPDLDLQIAKLVGLLTETGTLVVAVPNFKSYDAKYYKEYWAAFDVPRHLWHFSQKSIGDIFGKYGMKLVRTKPMFFDAFYVALLSEKYKMGKQNFLRAFAIGLISNLLALRSKEYSSLIYVMERR